MYYNLPGEKQSVVLEGDNEMLGLSENYTIIKEGFFFDCYFTRDASVDVPVPESTDVVTYDLDTTVKMNKIFSREKRRQLQYFSEFLTLVLNNTSPF